MIQRHKVKAAPARVENDDPAIRIAPRPAEHKPSSNGK
jgi:hypothetical protein